VLEAADAYHPLLKAFGLSEEDADDLALLLADQYHDIRTLRIAMTRHR
jgi:hypothetical protein